MKKLVIAAAIAFALFAAPVVGYSTAEIGKKEAKPCTACHTKPLKGDENLNDTGKCYKEKKDLKACEVKK